MRNFIFGAVSLLIVAVLIGGAYYFGLKQARQTGVFPPPALTPTVAPVPSVEPIVTIAPTPEASKEDDEKEILAALYKKNNWPQDLAVTIHLSNNDGTYAGGTVASGGGGGYVFAKKVAGKWMIVADGNGIISCAAIASFPDFPSSLIPECYDEPAGKTVKR